MEDCPDDAFTCCPSKLRLFGNNDIAVNATGGCAPEAGVVRLGYTVGCSKIHVGVVSPNTNEPHLVQGWQALPRRANKFIARDAPEEGNESAIAIRAAAHRASSFHRATCKQSVL